MILYLYDKDTKLLQYWTQSDNPDSVQNSTVVSPFASQLSTVPKWNEANNRWVDSDQPLTLNSVPDFSYTKQLSDMSLQIAKLTAAAKGSGNNG